MSTPMDGRVFVQSCRAKGLNVIEMVVDGKSWLNNNRNHIGAWGPVSGDTVHHTGSDTSNAFEYAKFLFRGRSDLPGPLCQRGTAPNGDVYMIGWGRANHAGSGDSDTMNALLADAVPLDREIRPDASGPTDGNRAMYGNEVMYSGGHPMTAAQLNSALLQDVVICQYHGWTGASVIGHREWTNQKPDPGFVDMAAYRRKVDQMLANVQPPPPPPPQSKESDMWLFSSKAGAVLLVSSTGVRLVKSTSDLATLEALGTKYGDPDSNNRAAYKGMDEGPFALIIDLHGGIQK